MKKLHEELDKINLKGSGLIFGMMKNDLITVGTFCTESYEEKSVNWDPYLKELNKSNVVTAKKIYTTTPGQGHNADRVYVYHLEVKLK